MALATKTESQAIFNKLKMKNANKASPSINKHGPKRVLTKL
jgi:hypothetical protein